MTFKRRRTSDVSPKHNRKHVVTGGSSFNEEDTGSDDLIDEFFCETDSSTEQFTSDSDFSNSEGPGVSIGGEEDSEVDISDASWEDVTLDDGIKVSVGVATGERKDNNLVASRKAANKRRREQYQFLKSLKFGLHLALIPFLLKTLRDRIEWTKDERLNRRLRRSVPKLINKKFSEWAARDKELRHNSLRTLLLGLVMWFRSNYKVNSNGFRQNFGQLDTLMRLSTRRDAPSGGVLPLAEILGKPEVYYGSRPTMNSTEVINDVRAASKRKMANRDILTLFFFVILKNIIPCGQLKDLSLCFALPLIEFEDLPNCDMYEIPNKFDSDLLQPNFWIELQLVDDVGSLYVIDPVVKLDKSEIVSRFKIDEPVPYFEQTPSSAYTTKQYFRYVVRGDFKNTSITDVSPRYVKNLCYRYFPLTHESQVLSSKDYKSYTYFKRMLKRINKGEDSEDSNLLRTLAFKNYVLPKSLKELKKSNNFITREQLQKSQCLVHKSTELLRLLNGSTLRDLPKVTINGKSYALHWKNQVINLRSEQRWLVLGRSVIEGEKPLRQKQHHVRTLSSQEDRFEIRNLFAWEQTRQTPKLPSYYSDTSGGLRVVTDVDFYRNKYGNVEIFTERTMPDGFKLIELGSFPNIRSLIRGYNKNAEHKVKFLNVVSRFDFKERRGFAMPVIDSIMVNEKDYKTLLEIVNRKKEEAGLQKWMVFLSRLTTRVRLDRTYGTVDEEEPEDGTQINLF